MTEIKFPHQNPMEEIDQLRRELDIAMTEGQKLQDFTRAKNIRVTLDQKIKDLKNLMDPWQYEWRRNFAKEYNYRYVGIPNDYGLMTIEISKDNWCILSQDNHKASPTYKHQPFVGKNSFVAEDSILRNGDFSEFNTKHNIGFTFPFHDDWSRIYYWDFQDEITYSDYLNRNDELLGIKLDQKVHSKDFHNNFATIKFPGGKIRTKIIELTTELSKFQVHDLIGFKPESDFENGLMVVSNKSGFTYMDTKFQVNQNYFNSLTPLVNGVAFALIGNEVYRVNKNLEILDYICNSYSNRIITRGDIFCVYNRNKAHDLYNYRGELMHENTYQIRDFDAGILRIVKSREFYIDFNGKEIFS